MNCKPNDLAVISRPPKSIEELRGRIVRVITPGVGPRGRAIWSIEKELGFVVLSPCRDAYGRARYVGESVFIEAVEDSWLTPLRDEPDEDETLTWAGKPSEITTERA